MGDGITALEDERAITKLVLKYARGADTRDGALFASIFTPDGVLQRGEQQTAGQEKLAKVPRILEAYTKSYHTMNNTLIEIDGDSASGVIYSAAHHLRPIEGTTYSDRVMYITYHDSYVRTAEGWRIAHRNVVTEFIEYRTVTIND